MNRIGIWARVAPRVLSCSCYLVALATQETARPIFVRSPVRDGEVAASWNRVLPQATGNGAILAVRDGRWRHWDARCCNAALALSIAPFGLGRWRHLGSGPTAAATGNGATALAAIAPFGMGRWRHLGIGSCRYATGNGATDFRRSRRSGWGGGGILRSGPTVAATGNGASHCCGRAVRVGEVAAS